MHSLRRVKHSIRYSVSHLERTSSSFLKDVLQVCWLFDVCTAYKVQRLRYSQSVRQSLTVNSFVRGFTVLLFINWLVLQCSFIKQLFVILDLLLQIDANEHSCNSSVHLCVLSDIRVSLLGNVCFILL